MLGFVGSHSWCYVYSACIHAIIARPADPSMRSFRGCFGLAASTPSSTAWLLTTPSSMSSAATWCRRSSLGAMLLSCLCNWWQSPGCKSSSWQSHLNCDGVGIAARGWRRSSLSCRSMCRTRNCGRASSCGTGSWTPTTCPSYSTTMMTRMNSMAGSQVNRSRLMFGAGWRCRRGKRRSKTDRKSVLPCDFACPSNCTAFRRARANS